jgi:hypothetical protein
MCLSQIRYTRHGCVAPCMVKLIVGHSHLCLLQYSPFRLMSPALLRPGCILFVGSSRPAELCVFVIPFRVSGLPMSNTGTGHSSSLGPGFDFGLEWCSDHPGLSVEPRPIAPSLGYVEDAGDDTGLTSNAYDNIRVTSSLPADDPFSFLTSISFFSSPTEINAQLRNQRQDSSFGLNSFQATPYNVAAARQPSLPAVLINVNFSLCPFPFFRDESSILGQTYWIHDSG